MGFRCTWIACKGWDVPTLVARSGRRLSGEEDECLNVGIYALQAEGWSILAGDGSDYMGRIDWDDAVAWSEDTDVLFFATNDTVMVGGLSFLRGGETTWSVSCDASQGDAPAQFTGELPPEVQAVLEQQSEGYEVPADAGQALTGFRHDRSWPVLLLER